MILPKVPAWFSKGLKAVDATLVCRFTVGQGWQVCQKMPYAKDMGYWDGFKILQMKTRLEPILDIPEPGSRAFTEIRMFHSSRFKTFVNMCKELNIRNEE